MTEKVELIAEGCIGTCWYGKYHYVEPYIGCSHGCHYCYARYTSEVVNSLADHKTDFNDPQPVMEPDVLLKELRQSVSTGDISIVKLSRFTDIFCSPFVENGLCYQVMKTLLNSPVKRVIITTKSYPDRRTKALMMEYKDKVSYNVAVKPESGFPLEANVPLTDEKLAVASEFHKAGVLTTIHMDPIIPFFEDQETQLRVFLEQIKNLGLNRVMFSYLLLNAPMIKRLQEKMGQDFVDTLLQYFALDSDLVQILPNQEETQHICMKQEEQQSSINRISDMIYHMGLDFVLCRIKSMTADIKAPDHCRVCNGQFYA